MQVKQRVKYWGTTICWKFNDKWHRDGDLPSIYHFYSGKLYSVVYCQHGKDHCITGPAIIYYVDKIKYYHYQNRKYDSLEEMLMVEACR